MTMKKLLMEKAKQGGYGFNQDYILENYHVKQATTPDEYFEKIRDAVISYSRWQLDIVKGNYGYVQQVKDDLCKNIDKQLRAFDFFDQDWQVACEIEGLRND